MILDGTITHVGFVLLVESCGRWCCALPAVFGEGTCVGYVNLDFVCLVLANSDDEQKGNTNDKTTTKGIKGIDHNRHQLKERGNLSLMRWVDSLYSL